LAIFKIQKIIDTRHRGGHVTSIYILEISFVPHLKLTNFSFQRGLRTMPLQYMNIQVTMKDVANNKSTENFLMNF
jgi:hypothetical protein